MDFFTIISLFFASFITLLLLLLAYVATMAQTPSPNSTKLIPTTPLPSPSPPTTFAILGGTTPAGEYISNFLLQQGHSIRLLIPSHPTTAPPSLLSHPQAEIIQGTVTDPLALSSLFQGASVALSLGVGEIGGGWEGTGEQRRRKNGQVRPKVYERMTQAVLKASAKNGQIKRYLALSGAGVSLPGDKRSRMGVIFQLVNKVVEPVRVGDKQKEADLLVEKGGKGGEGEGVEWVLVRCPRLVRGKRGEEGEKGRVIKVNEETPIGASVNVEDLAAFLLREALTPEYVNKGVFVAS